VGPGEEEGSIPKEKGRKNQVDYPWGAGFPPPKDRVGNYADSAYHEKFTKERDKWIEGYTDGFATTAPVGSFKPNEYGIHALGGNVWEWREDLHEPGSTYRIVRGASWAHFGREGMQSSYRRPFAPDSRLSNYGFRCVLGPVAR
jgi:formylglycine-generating enzyme required for sulfatase activity